MEREKLISRLNWFYALEVTQVDNYISQAKMIKDKYISKALVRFASIEQEHVDNIAEYIKGLGSEPTQSRDVISSYLGKLVGNITPTTGIINMLRINVAVEQKAKADYKKLIDEVKDKKLLDTLWANFIDEDLHTAWMIERIDYLTLDAEKKKLKL
ncbi:MAG: ferritin-like domain-containing protein [Clostridiales bacterium]|nr:ferritin-like domain-containing protein [Clostridiales bacterium]